MVKEGFFMTDKRKKLIIVSEILFCFGNLYFSLATILYIITSLCEETSSIFLQEIITTITMLFYAFIGSNAVGTLLFIISTGCYAVGLLLMLIFCFGIVTKKTRIVLVLDLIVLPIYFVVINLGFEMLLIFVMLFMALILPILTVVFLAKDIKSLE